MKWFQLSGVEREAPVYSTSAIAFPFAGFVVGITLAQLFYRSALAPMIARLFGGHVDVELVAGAVMLALAVLGFRAGRISVLPRRTLRHAAIQLALFWSICQVVLIIYDLATQTPITIAAGWRGDMLAGQQLVFQFFAIALVEEWIFRGLLIPQLYRRLRGRIAGLLVAVVIADAIFTACHIPMIVGGGGGNLAGQLLHIGLLGLVYSLCYLRTGGIAAGVAFHVLSNAPSALIDSPLYAGDVVLVLFWLRLLIPPAVTAA